MAFALRLEFDILRGWSIAETPKGRALDEALILQVKRHVHFDEACTDFSCFSGINSALHCLAETRGQIINIFAAGDSSAYL